MIIARTLLVVLALGKAFAADRDPRALAESIIDSWSLSDRNVLVAVAHPELLERLRTARISDFYVSDKPEKKKVLESGEDTEVIAIFCEALRAIVPEKDTRVEYFNRFLGSLPQGELLIVRFESGWKRKIDGTIGVSRSQDIVLKKSRGEWRFLWSAAVQVHVDLSWDPREGNESNKSVGGNGSGVLR